MISQIMPRGSIPSMYLVRLFAGSFIVLLRRCRVSIAFSPPKKTGV